MHWSIAVSRLLLLANGFSVLMLIASMIACKLRSLECDMDAVDLVSVSSF
jgi:hypothetical protein